MKYVCEHLCNINNRKVALFRLQQILQPKYSVVLFRFYMIFKSGDTQLRNHLVDCLVMHRYLAVLFMQTSLDGVFSKAVEPGTVLSAGYPKVDVFRPSPSEPEVS